MNGEQSVTQWLPACFGLNRRPTSILVLYLVFDCLTVSLTDFDLLFVELDEQRTLSNIDGRWSMVRGRWSMVQPSCRRCCVVVGLPSSSSSSLSLLLLSLVVNVVVIGGCCCCCCTLAMSSRRGVAMCFVRRRADAGPPASHRTRFGLVVLKIRPRKTNQDPVVQTWSSFSAIASSTFCTTAQSASNIFLFLFLQCVFPVLQRSTDNLISVHQPSDDDHVVLLVC